MPTDVKAHRSDDRLPRRPTRPKTYEYLRKTTHAEDASTAEFPAGYMFKDVPNRLDEGDDGVEVTVAEMDKWGVEIGMVGAGTDATVRAMKDHPGRFIGSIEIDPNDITGAVRKIRSMQGGARHQGGHDVPGRLQPAGPGERPSLLPDLPDVHRPRHPDRVERGHRRSALPVGVSGRDAVRRGLLRLPRAAHRDAPRRGAVGGARGEAHAQVAEPLLHAQRVRAQALPEGDHRLREHARRRQGHVRRLLPDGPEPRAHLHRDARRAVPRPRVAEVPARQRDPRVQARREAVRS